MIYLPLKTISISNNRLIESFDLTKPLSSFLHKRAYLALIRNETIHVISLASILNTLTTLDLTKSIGTVFSGLLSDAFVEQYAARGIPVRTPKGNYNNRLSVFNPIAYKSFRVQFTSINSPTVRDDITRKGFLDDLVITSDEDMSNYLVAVNGVFHRTIYLNNEVFVIDGFRTMRISGKKDVLIVDTRDVGGHTIVPMTKETVTKSAYQKPAVVKLPSSIVGKTVFAVIDGYFYHRDQKVLGVVNEDHLRIYTHKLPLIQQYRHNPRTMHQQDRLGADADQSSRLYKDPYESLFIGKRSIASNLLANADFQYAKLTAYHSFIVVFNNPNLFTVDTDISPTGTPQMYQDLSNRFVSGMLTYGCGLHPTYLIWKDLYGRKRILLPQQDYDSDYQDDVLLPNFVPSLIRDETRGTRVFAKFVDYIGA